MVLYTRSDLYFFPFRDLVVKQHYGESCTKRVKILKQIVGNEVTLIAVGGIENSLTAQQKLQAGADLLQVYSGLIYQGTKLVAECIAATSR